MKTYSIIRFFESGEQETIKKYLSIEEAKEHCSDSETSSRTCQDVEELELTSLRGRWFDGYREEWTMKKYYVEFLKQGTRGIDVYLSQGYDRIFIENVHPNIVRCTIGENDMEYLLKTKNAEGFCVLTEVEIIDFTKNILT